MEVDMNKYSFFIMIMAVLLVTVSAMAQSPGVVMGATWYDMQTLSSSGNRIAVCEDGSMYICWMDASIWPPPTRGVSCCWRSPAGDWNCGVLAEGGAFPQLDIYNDIHGAIVYHAFFAYVMLAVDYMPWRFYNPPDSTPEGGRCFWPYITTGQNDGIHILMTESMPVGDCPRLFYTRSDNGGPLWSEPQLVDTVATAGSVLDASPVSDRVIITYARPDSFEIFWCNDIFYVISEDGLNWDFMNSRVNVTNYGDDEDSLWAFFDIDAIFDYNDNFHLIWNAGTVDSEGWMQWKTRLFHYNSATDEINLIHMWPEENYWNGGCDCGAWNRPICKMNLGVHTSNVLFVTWTQFDTTDCSEGGYANGDIFMSYTISGTDWEEPVNLTNSNTDGCFPGACDSDHWSTLADVVNDTLHIVYINDKDAGGIPHDEGVATENPVMYLAYPVDDIVRIDEETNRPASFSLMQNYPNPFNVKTTILFELKKASKVLLEVFDITGAKVTTLVNEFMLVGSHSITWDAEDFASGVYFYRLKTGDTSETKTAVLIR
jgi:hypothetical protein